jgi:tetrahydromethanopterin S-methyltransferase subunit G
MSDATIITTIVSLGVAYLGSAGLIAHVLGARIDDLRADMQAGFVAVNARFDDVNARFDARFDDVNARFDARFDEVNSRIDGVSRRIDVQSERITRLEQRVDAVAQIVAEHEGRLK